MNVNDLTYALIICLFGMGVVFCILIGLSLITKGVKLFSKADIKEDKSGIIEVDEESHPVEDRAFESVNQPGEEELAAVIAAAVQSILEEKTIWL
jgi:sodium pump decarboxylase gamma subunit